MRRSRMSKDSDLEFIRKMEYVIYAEGKFGLPESVLKLSRSVQVGSIEQFKRDYGEEPNLLGAVESQFPGGQEPDWNELHRKLRNRPLKLRVLGVFQLEPDCLDVGVEILQGGLDWFQGTLHCAETPGEWRITGVALIDPRTEANADKELLGLSGPPTLQEGMVLVGRPDPF